MPLSQIKESEGVTCHSTERPGGYLVKQVREKQTLCPLYVESEKLTSESNKERNQLTDTENKPVVTSRESEEERLQDRGGEQEAQTTLRGVTDKDILCSSGDTADRL